MASLADTTLHLHAKITTEGATPEEIRRAAKRVERSASKLARDIGALETMLAKYGIAVEFITPDRTPSSS